MHLDPIHLREDVQDLERCQLLGEMDEDGKIRNVASRRGFGQVFKGILDHFLARSGDSRPEEGVCCLVGCAAA